MRHAAWMSLCALLSVVACAPQGPGRAAPQAGAFAAIAVPTEQSDLLCPAEAKALNAALGQARTAPVLDAFDKVLACREARAADLRRDHGSGRLRAAQAAAGLIGLRGATRRDVARIRLALGIGNGTARLNARLAAALQRQRAFTLEPT